MLEQYEQQFAAEKESAAKAAVSKKRRSRSPVPPPPVFHQQYQVITNKKWRAILEKRNLNPLDYLIMPLQFRHDATYTNFKPSQVMLRPGNYPFRNVDENQDIFCLFSGISGNSKFVDSADP